jgi:zinc transport system substrate-binding protein
MSRNLLPLSLTAIADGRHRHGRCAAGRRRYRAGALAGRARDGGCGTPDLILPPGATPHEYSLRPSEAAALQEADIVVWMGEDLTPWMEDAVETLAVDAAVMTLLEADGTTLLDFREGALFEAHTHDHGDHDHGS